MHSNSLKSYTKSIISLLPFLTNTSKAMTSNVLLAHQNVSFIFTLQERPQPQPICSSENSFYRRNILFFSKTMLLRIHQIIQIIAGNRIGRGNQVKMKTQLAKPIRANIFLRKQGKIPKLQVPPSRSNISSNGKCVHLTLCRLRPVVP